MDYSEMSIAELFAESDRVGNQYLTPEEIAAQQNALEAEADRVAEILAADPEAAAIAEELFGN